MKKIFLVLLSLVLILGLVACSNNSNNIYTSSFKARVMESNGSTVIVEPLENEEIRRSTDKISIGIGKIKEFIPDILPAGTLVEIVYDGNINESYPAQINVLGFKTIEEENEIPTTVAYANWIDSEVAFESDEKCLNLDKYIFSDFPRLPTFKFDTKSELDEFKEKYKDVFTMDHGYDEVASFNEVTANYDEKFFQNYSLILTYKEASSGSFRYGISEVEKNNGVLVMKVTKTNNPEVYTDDMSGWFLMAEVEKDYIKDCKEFDTQVWEERFNDYEGFDTQTWEKYSSNFITTESNKITIKNGQNEYDSINVDRIKRFIENSNKGMDDEIEVTQYTIEGDPIITTVRYNGIDDTFEVIIDTTQDKFGKPEIIKKEYDNTYKAKLSGEELVNEDVSTYYYAFQLVNEEDVVDICFFNY